MFSLRLFPFHIWLLGLSPVFYLFSRNIEQLSLIDLWKPILFILVFNAVVWVLLKKIFKDARKAGLLLTVWQIFFFTYGQFYETIKDALKGLHLLPGKSA